MENFFKCLLLLIIFIIISLVVYYIYTEHNSSKIYKANNRIKKWQRERLIKLVNQRIMSIQKNGKTIHQDEKEILEKFVKNNDKIENWNDIDKIVNDFRIYSFINVSIMDNLYLSNIDTIESKNEFLQNLFILDCVNEGVKYEGKKPQFYPKDIDIKETIQLIINNQEELTETQSNILSSFIANAWKKNDPTSFNEFKAKYLKNNFKDLISDSAIEKTMTELNNKKYVKDLSKPTKYVASKIIIEIISNIIYSGNNYCKISNNAKVYLRILANVVANDSYENIYNKFQN